MPQNNRILLAQVLSPHGIKGQVKIVAYSDDPLKLEKYDLVDQKDNPVKVKYTNNNKAPVKYHNGNPVMITTLNGAKNRNDAESQRKLEIFVSRDQLDDEEEGEFYYADLLGMDVINHEDGNKIGKVTNVLDHGGGTMLLIVFEENPDKPINLKEEFFTFKDEIFPEVDVANNKITIILPEIAEIKPDESKTKKEKKKKDK